MGGHVLGDWLTLPCQAPCQAPCQVPCHLTRAALRRTVVGADRAGRTRAIGPTNALGRDSSGSGLTAASGRPHYRRQNCGGPWGVGEPVARQISPDPASLTMIKNPLPVPFLLMSQADRMTDQLAGVLWTLLWKPAEVLWAFLWKGGLPARWAANRG